MTDTQQGSSRDGRLLHIKSPRVVCRSHHMLTLSLPVQNSWMAFDLYDRNTPPCPVLSRKNSRDIEHPPPSVPPLDSFKLSGICLVQNVPGG